MTVHPGNTLPGLTEQRTDKATTIRLSGDWTVHNAQLLEELADGPQPGGLSSVTLDMAGVTLLDTAGAWMVHRIRSRFEHKGARVKFARVPERLTILLTEIEGHSPPPWAPLLPGNPLLSFFERVGRSMIEVCQDTVAVLNILGSFGIALVSCLTRLSRLRGTAIMNQFEQACVGAVPIVALMSFLIGGIIAQQGAFYLARFGADIYAVDLVGILMVREIGVLLTAIMVAGRSGSAFTAELGSMKMREEIDALRVLGLDYIEVLILPRVIALILTMPILTFVADVAGLTGAGLLLWVYNGIVPAAYLDLLHAALMWDWRAMLIGFAKAPFMALIIALIGCVEGLKVEGSAESLGRHTTLSVVKSIFMVIVLDGVFALFFAAMGL